MARLVRRASKHIARLFELVNFFKLHEFNSPYLLTVPQGVDIDKR